MNKYGNWEEQLIVEGKSYRADLAEQTYADRAGHQRIYAINGLPPKFINNLVRASQVSDTPHTWRVKECKSEDEVTDDILILGTEALKRDMKELNAHVITYVGGSEDRLEFLAAGAIRDKLTKDYQNVCFPVVSRAIVAPKHRGKGLGSLIVEHRMKAVLRYFDQAPKAIHFGTESKKILRSVEKVEQHEGINFVYIGDERYTSSDGTHTVHDYLCFLPGYREELLTHCDQLHAGELFKEKLKRFMELGVRGVSGNELAELFDRAVRATASSEGSEKAIEGLRELFLVKEKIGARDPA